jgi:hypothetical protein
VIDLNIGEAKSQFFDRDITRSLDAATRKALSKAGAFIRRTAKGLIRKGKKASQPGKPPKSHTGLLKDFLFFCYEPSLKSVVVGPARLDKPGLAPAVLEFGGDATVTRRLHQNGRRVERRRKIHILPRPYMSAAFAKEQPKFAALWGNQMRPA